MIGYAAASTTIGLAGSWLSLFAALAGWGLFQGGLDVAMNTQAATVERLAGAPVMARFHGMWSVGALAGAVSGAACVGAGVPLAAQLGVIGVVVAILVEACTRGLVPDREPGHAPGRVGRGWLTPTVAVLAAVSFASFLCEGAAGDWSGNYLRNVVGAGPAVSGLSYAAYTLTMVVTRFGAIRLHSRMSSRRLLPALALLAAVGMCVTLAVANPVVSIAGFALLGAGVALLVPTAFSAAYPAGQGGSAIAIVAATGWVGYLLGPPLIGQLSATFGLSAALLVIPVMLCVAGVAIRASKAFDAADEFHREASTVS